ncbi:MAG: adenylosuccinate lyase, partial [Proteobacteria bacterium]|nr:adenylosuccinate lyase [Pseudomonadota bacterium]
MIERYSYPQMRAIWEQENRYRKWLEVELLVAEGWAEIGRIPKEAAGKLRANGNKLLAEGFDFGQIVQRTLELEGDVPGFEPKPGQPVIRHDLVAFLTAVSEHLGKEKAYLHFGVTSYDIEDTATCMLLRESCDLIEEGAGALAEAIRERAREHKWTPMIGRTHGVHAEPITFGLKLAVWLAELERDIERVRQARESVSVAMASGPVGSYGTVDPRVEEYVCKRLGVEVPKATSQIVQRDRYAHYVTTLAIMAGSLERFATEVRNLQRTEILEVEEPFKKGQRGSSAMPHKRNPMTCERVTGLARIVRSYVVPALENMAQWHERDLTNSSVERIILPDSSVLIDYMLRKFTDVVKGMVVYPEHMRANLEKMKGMVMSEHVMLALVDKGMAKDEAYRTVQAVAMKAFESGGDPSTSLRASFRELVAQDPAISGKIEAKELKECFDLCLHLKKVKEAYK